MDDALRAHARAAGQAIRARDLRGARLLNELLAVPFCDRDVWVDEALGLETAPDDVPDLPPGAVPYVPCGVDAIVRTVLDAPVTADDVFADLGAGLGRVALLVHLLSGARAVGVELQAPLVARARRSARSLALPDVTFQLGDAATTEVPEATVYFIYASFGPAVLHAVLRWLRRVAARKRVVLCAVGFEVRCPDWLAARASRSPELTLYDSIVSAGRAPV
jgi:protein-L-isoaspartate O-methyltransferase